MSSSDSPARDSRLTWHAREPASVLEALSASDRGLTTDDARRRLEEHGPNVLSRTSGESAARILWRQINDPLIWVLIGSSMIAVAIGKVTDGLVVAAVVVLNAIIGFVQEYRANKAIEALRGMVPEYAHTLRDGETASVAVADLVPGDIVKLASGDKVPADLRLLSTKNLRIEEAALTGESVPVEKAVGAVAEDTALGDRRSMAFGGTLVTYGTATAVVVATGERTELGRISAMLQETSDLDTPLTRALGGLARVITVGIGALAAVIVAIGLWRSLAVGVALEAALRETLIFAIALAVGAIPEGLPAIVTIALAIGVRRMAARRAIIRRLPAVETLGSTTVICTDKTGTLTRNEMTVQALWTPEHGQLEVSGVGYEPHGQIDGWDADSRSPTEVSRLLENAALCNDAHLSPGPEDWRITGDPTEGALVVAAEKAGLRVAELRSRLRRLDVIPFESEHQYMATLHEDDGGARIVLKGAPEAILPRCEGIDVDAVRARVEAIAERGMRVLAVAEKRAEGPALEAPDVEGGCRLNGLLGMIDPPRAEAIAAVQQCREAGIRVKMITGDHQVTAKAIGQQLALAEDAQPVEGREIATLDASSLQELSRARAVFARVAPEHKLRIVEALQRDEHVVAMTGDGVNDAPALKQSNIGVAMGITGTSVAKESADIVLTDDNFATIVAAVEEGRRVYDNLVKSLAFVLPTNLGLAFILMFAVMFLPFDPATQQLLLPIAPTQLLWINLVAAVALALPLAFEAKEPNLMRRPPRDPKAPILSRLVVRRTAIASVLMTAGALALFRWEYGVQSAADGQPLAKAQTMAVTTVIMFQVYYMLMSRSLHDSIHAIGYFSNPYVFLGIGVTLGLQAAFVYAPPLQAVFGTAALEARELALSAGAGLIVVPAIVLDKWLARSRSKRDAREQPRA